MTAWCCLKKNSLAVDGRYRVNERQQNLLLRSQRKGATSLIHIQSEDSLRRILHASGRWYLVLDPRGE